MQHANGKNGTINGYKNESLNIAVVGGGLVSKNVIIIMGSFRLFTKDKRFFLNAALCNQITKDLLCHKIILLNYLETVLNLKINQPFNLFE